MTDTPTLEQPRRFHFDWLLPTLLNPRHLFKQVVEATRDSWLTPLIIISIAELLRVGIEGWLKQNAASLGMPSLPPGSEFWTPEQQASYLQAAQAQNSPVFLYVFPAVLGLAGVWLNWLLLGSILHFVLTLFGGRSQTRTTLNVVAWALLPLAVRALLRAGYMWYTNQPITAASFAGYVPADIGVWGSYLKYILTATDIFLIWALVLMTVGATIAATLPTRKAIFGVLLTVLVVLLLQALPGFLWGELSGLSVIRF